MKSYELTKSENGRLDNLLSIARIHEETLNCITESYRNFVIGTIFKRLGLEAEDFAKTIVDLNKGELVVKDKETLPKGMAKAEVKGEKNAD